MKISRTLAITASLLVALSACDRGEHRDFAQQESTVEYVRALARDLASDNAWLTDEVIQKLESRAVVLEEIPNVKGTSASKLSRLSSGGTDYEVIAELHATTGSMGKKLSGSAPYRVALDPDKYYFPEEIEEETLDELPEISVPTFYFDGQSATPREEVVTIGARTQLNEPLITLTVREEEESGETLTKASAPIPGTYLGLASLTLKTKRDNSNEEFEMYFSNGHHVSNDPFLGRSAFKFNGNDYADAANVTKNFPDVNTYQVYTNDGIALRALDGPSAVYKWRLIGIEDDNYAGKYARIDYNDYPDHIVYTPIDYYDMEDGGIEASQNTAFRLDSYSTSNDDRYIKSGVMNIDLTNLTTRLAGQTYFDTGSTLFDITWRFRKVIH